MGIVVLDNLQYIQKFYFSQAAPGQLAKEVLAEVPKQVTDFFRINGIAPLQNTNQPPPPQFQPSI